MIPNKFGNDQVEYRGYEISSFDVSKETLVKRVNSKYCSLTEGDIVIYKANPINQFNKLQQMLMN